MFPCLFIAVTLFRDFREKIGRKSVEFYFGSCRRRDVKEVPAIAMDDSKQKPPYPEGSQQSAASFGLRYVQLEWKE